MAAIIKIVVETSGGLESVKKDVQDLGATAKESGGGFNALQEIATGAMRAIGEAVTGLALKGFQMLGDAISDGIADAKQNAQIQAQTAAVLKSTGDAAGRTTEQIAAYASSLSDAAGKSLFGDDQIQQSANLLLTFTNIKDTTLDAATAISVDMAQALGGAPKDAAIQLGKALNDPVKGITALTRVGVTFSDEQKAQIQAMQEAGDTAGAQAVILAELNKEFGGSAAAAAAATGGWSEFNGRMGEAKEALGAALLPLLNSLAGVLNDTVLPMIENAAAAFGPFMGKVTDTVQMVMEAFGENGLSGAINTLIYNVFGLESNIGGLADGALATVSTVLNTQLIPAFQSVWAVIQTQVWPILQNLMTALFPLVGAAIQILSGFWTDVLVPAMQVFWQFLTGFVFPILAALAGWLRDNLPGAIQVVADFLTGTLFPALHTIYDFIGVYLEPILAILAQWLIENVPVAIQKATDFFNGTLLPALNAIWAFIQDNVIPILRDVATWLITNVPVAIQKATDFWNTVLLPALTAVWVFIRDSVIPIIEKIVTVTFVALTTAVNDMSTLWKETLKPALDAVWQFINTYINPILEKLANVVIALIKLELAALSALWNTVLLPAITAVYNFIKDNIVPIFNDLVTLHIAALKKSFKDLSDFWTLTFKPALATIYNFLNDFLAPKMATFNSNVLQPMQGFFEDIGTAIDGLIRWLNKLADKWAELKPPDWVKGASPPPMADWFNDIGSAVASLNAQLPTLQMNLAAQIGPQGQSIVNTASTRSFTYAPNISTSGNVSAPMDLALATSLAGV